MENYNYTPSYPESGDSSPRSREIDFENPPPWEDQNQPQSQTYRVKFMCSYGGKIHPRPHDNQLSYVGGETKILAVDRGIKFSSLNSKLSALCAPLDDGITFKYQLPGEDLDALISVTNDDDLEHMMHEYDRLYRASPKPARLRLFLFPMNPPPLSGSQRSFGSEEGRSEKERFVEALNSGPVLQSPVAVEAQQNNVDFLFGLEKGSGSAQHVQGLPHAPHQVKIRDPMTEMINEPEQVPVQCEDRAMALDPIQKHIQDLQRLRLEEQQGLYGRNSDDNLSGGYPGGEYYVQKFPEKVAQVQGTGQIPPNYWPEKQIQGGGGGVYQGTTITGEQQFYMMPPPPHGGAYHPHPHPHPHPQMVRPMNPPVNQGYYAVQRMQPEMYNVVSNTSMPPPVAAAPPPAQPQPQAQQRYTDGISMGRPAAGGGIGMGMVDAGQYSQMMYDNNGVGRQVYYNAPGGQVMSAPPPPLPGGSAPQYQAVPADMRQGGALNHDGGKVVPKVTQASG